MLIGQAVSRVFQGDASQVIRERSRPLRPMVVGLSRTLLLIGLPITLAIVLGGPWLFETIFGSTWSQAGQFARILAIGYLADITFSPVSLTLLLLERQGAQLRWDVFRMTLTVGAPLAVAALGAPATYAVLALACATVTCYGILFLVCVRAAERHDALHFPAHAHPSPGR